MLKLTTASYWRPSNQNIHRHSDADEADDWGVIPDKGCRVKVDEEQLAKLLSARFRRDVHRRNHENDSANQDDPADPDGGGKFVSIRDGSVRWPAVRQALARIGYEGWMTIEGGGLSPEEHSERLDLIIAGK